MHLYHLYKYLCKVESGNGNFKTFFGFNCPCLYGNKRQFVNLIKTRLSSFEGTKDMKPRNEDIFMLKQLFDEFMRCNEGKVIDDRDRFYLLEIFHEDVDGIRSDSHDYNINFYHTLMNQQSSKSLNY